MDVQVEKISSYLTKISVQIPENTVNQAFDKATHRVQKKAQLPGFRAGKIPRALLERHFGPQIYQDVQSHLVEGTLFEAISTQKVPAVAMPQVTPGLLQRNQPFKYTAEVEVRPEISLTQYKKLPVPRFDAALDASQVDARLDSMRKEAAQTVPVLDRNTVENGDLVLLDYAGTLAGKPFEGGKADNAMVEVGGADYIPGFSEGLVGAEVPSTIDVPVTFPKEYSVPHLAGQDAVFQMQLKELKKREQPALDDEFAKDQGADNLAALRQRIEDELATQHKQEQEGKTRQAVLKALIEANPFEVPPSMVDSQVERLIERAKARMAQMFGQKYDLGEDFMADLRGSRRPDAEFQVRASLLMLEVSQAEKFSIDDTALDQEITRIASEETEHNATLVRQYYEKPEHREDLRFRLLEDKTVAFLLDVAERVDAPAA